MFNIGDRVRYIKPGNKFTHKEGIVTGFSPELTTIPQIKLDDFPCTKVDENGNPRDWRLDEKHLQLLQAAEEYHLEQELTAALAPLFKEHAS